MTEHPSYHEPKQKELIIMNNRIDEELGVLSKTIEQSSWKVDEQQSKIEVRPSPLELLKNDDNDIEKDYEYQRENFYNLVEKGSAAIEGILELAKESEHPRTYEVAGNLIKQVAEVTEKLGDLQEKMRRLKELPNTAPKNVTNALFVGSTTELQKMIKGKYDEISKKS